MRSLARPLALAALGGLAMMACTQGETTSSPAPVAAKTYPAIGPLPARKPPAESAVALGKRLFYDARLSGDGAISCAACHAPDKGFGDGLPLSKAYPGTAHYRNAPTLINTVYKNEFKNTGWGWDGRMGADLNDVVRNELTESAMMNMDMRLMHERMKQEAEYIAMCQAAYKSECSSSVARRALEAYMATLISRDAPFDKGALSPEAARGRALFEGKAGCVSCHNGPYFSDGEPHNTGVPENMDVFRDPVRHLTYRSIIHSHGVPKMEIWRRDVGYFLVSKNYSDVGKFVTPTLRELKYTAPYMHNGAFATLDDVVEFYNQGGGKDDSLAGELKPLGLSSSEKSDLVSFLLSLSSSLPVTDTRPVVPQKYQPTSKWLDVKN